MACIQRAFRCRGIGGGRRPNGLIWTCCCALCWFGCAASRGFARFKPRLKKAREHLEALRSFAGELLPEQTMAELRRLMACHQLASAQLRESEAERDRVLTVARPDREERMIRLLAQIVGLGMKMAMVLVRKILNRSVTAAPLPAMPAFPAHHSKAAAWKREQRIDRTGNAGLCRILVQLLGAGCASSRPAR